MTHISPGRLTAEWLESPHLGPVYGRKLLLAQLQVDTELQLQFTQTLSTVQTIVPAPRYRFRRKRVPDR